MAMDKMKVGVLFSQSGPMAVTEEALLRGTLLALEEINAAGGIGGGRSTQSSLILPDMINATRNWLPNCFCSTSTLNKVGKLR